MGSHERNALARHPREGLAHQANCGSVLAMADYDKSSKRVLWFLGCFIVGQMDVAARKWPV
jgi:hypothetical protein